MIEISRLLVDRERVKFYPLSNGKNFMILHKMGKISSPTLMLLAEGVLRKK